MNLIRTDIHLIDRQEKKDNLCHRVVELYHDPTGRKIRFEVVINHTPTYSTATVSVWDGNQWQRLHSLLEPSDAVAAITLLFVTTGELLGWPAHEAA